MKNKGKQIYLTIFVLVLAIIVLIGSSITLAFLGQTTRSSSAVRLANGVEVNSSVTITSPSMYVSPSQKLAVNAKATVKSPGDDQSITNGLLRAKIEFTTNSLPFDVEISNRTSIGKVNLYWRLIDGYYYLVTEEDGEHLYTIDTNLSGVDVPLNISIYVPSSIANADGGKEYKISVTFCTIQANIFNETGSNYIENTIENTVDIFDQVEGVEKPVFD